jgi:DNA repair exonuclease SbcCD nuclease subunit
MKNQIESVELPELNARVWGAGFEQKFAPALLKGFRAEKIPGVCDIMLLHGNVNKSASPYNPMTEEDIALSGIDYLALGHYHDTGGLCRAGNTFYAYSGCPEGRGFDECGEKTVFAADVAPGYCKITPYTIAERRYEILDINVSGREDVLSAAEERLPRDTEKDVYRLVLTGEAIAKPDINALYEALGDRFFHLQIRDKTTPYKDIWQSVGNDTLRGIFLRLMRDRLSASQVSDNALSGAADDTETEKITLAVKYAIAAMDGMEEP